MSKKNMKIIAILVMIISVGLIGYGIYFMNTSEYIFTRSVTKSFDKMISGLKEEGSILMPKDFTEAFEKGGVKSTNKFMMEELGQKLAFDVNLDAYMDAQAKKYYVLLNSKINNVDFLNLDVLLQENKAYMTVKNVLKNYYYQEMELPEVSKDKTGKEEVEKIINYFKDAFLNNINDDDYEKSKENITLGTKEYKAKVITLTISEGKASTIMLDFVNSIQKDDGLIEFLLKVTEKEKAELLNAFEQAKTALNESKNSNDTLLTYSVYVKNDDTLRHLIKVEDMKLMIDDYTNSNKYNSYKITGFSKEEKEEKEVFSFSIDGVDKEKSKYEFKIPDLATISGEYARNEKQATLAGKINVMSMELCQYQYKVETVKPNTEYQVNLSLTMAMDKNKISFTSKNIMDKTLSVPKIDVSKSLPYDKMTPEDQQALSKYMEKFQEMFGNTSPVLDNGKKVI